MPTPTPDRDPWGRTYGQALDGDDPEDLPRIVHPESESEWYADADEWLALEAELAAPMKPNTPKTTE